MVLKALLFLLIFPSRLLYPHWATLLLSVLLDGRVKRRRWRSRAPPPWAQRKEEKPTQVQSHLQCYLLTIHMTKTTVSKQGKYVSWCVLLFINWIFTGILYCFSIQAELRTAQQQQRFTNPLFWAAFIISLLIWSFMMHWELHMLTTKSVCSQAFWFVYCI